MRGDTFYIVNQVDDELTIGGVNSVDSTRDLRVHLPVFPFHRGNQVDGKLTIGGVNRHPAPSALV